MRIATRLVFDYVGRLAAMAHSDTEVGAALMAEEDLRRNGQPRVLRSHLHLGFGGDIQLDRFRSHLVAKHLNVVDAGGAEALRLDRQRIPSRHQPR